MKSYLISIPVFICLSLWSFVAIKAQPTPPQGFEWKVVPELTDEFDTWDGTKWWKPLWNYGEPVQMRAENSGVSEGKLWIKATLDSGAARWFQTSRVMSRTRINFPMYTECRMKTAHLSAYNTFWMNNGDINNRDEIDICENNSKPSCGCQPNFPWVMNSQYFITVNRDDERAKGNFDNRNLSATNPLRGVPWNEAYHTLGAWWKDKNNVQFYLDGEPAGNVTTTRDFTRELNIIWDLWTIAQNWSGGISAQQDLLDDSINTMKIDWIHTYSLENTGATSIEDDARSSIEFEVYPNPTDDHLYVRLTGPTPKAAKISLYNSLGQLMYLENFFHQEHQLPLTHFPSDLYMVKIEQEGLVKYQKIVKR